MEPLETRELAYFVAVAEELHFGRAARRLGMAQPPLSRAIRQLERRLGVLLLERSSRGVTLTPAGAVFLTESRKALDAVSAAGRRAQRAAEAVPRLTVAMKPDGDAGLLDRILSVYRRDPDSVEVEVDVGGVGEQAPALRDGRVDLAFLHRPHEDMDGFDTETLLVQDQVAVFPLRHRLADRPALVLADLEGEPLPRWPGMGPDEASGPVVREVGQLMQLVALGRAVAVLPEGVRRSLRADVVCVPVLDAPRFSIVLAWPERSRSRAIAAFVRAAVEVSGSARERERPLTA